MLQTICCYYNPIGYKNRYRNYCEFREKLDVPIQTIECVFEGQEPVISDAAICITANHNNFLWQKERLLNILIDSLPSECDKVAWLDTDIVFDNADWFSEADVKLDEHEVVQLFNFVESWNEDRSGIMDSSPSACYVYATEKVRSGAPGMAWAARRDLIQDGLYDRAIIGNADRMMFNRWVNEQIDNIKARELKELGVCEWGWQFLPMVWMEDSMKWGRPANSIGYVEGLVHHMWHGEREYRRYAQRGYQMDRFYKFHPQRDLILDSNGLWRTEREEILWYIKSYLEGRREDGDILYL